MRLSKSKYKKILQLCSSFHVLPQILMLHEVKESKGYKENKIMKKAKHKENKIGILTAS